jgi:hypothetical protein
MTLIAREGREEASFPFKAPQEHRQALKRRAARRKAAHLRPDAGSLDFTPQL